MVLFNYSTRELTAKIVFYGPGLCGKTTNLQFIHKNLSDNVRGIFWALLGLAGMTLGTRRANRNIWFVGVGLMTVVVLKLLVVDMSSAGTVARIVSFLGVGILLLVVGYISPVPPRSEKESAAD